MEELFLLIEKKRELKSNEQKFMAALQGHDLGGDEWSLNEKNPDIISDAGAFGKDGLFGVSTA